MPDDEYMLFCCNDLEHPCSFRVQAKTKEEVMEHAKTHISDVHDMEVTPAMEKKMEKVIKPVNVKDQSRMI
jgi:Protein of unknown function (DUF1059).